MGLCAYTVKKEQGRQGSADTGDYWTVSCSGCPFFYLLGLQRERFFAIT